MNIPDELVKELLELLDINDPMLASHAHEISHDWEEMARVNELRKQLWELKHKIEEQAKRD